MGGAGAAGAAVGAGAAGAAGGAGAAGASAAGANVPVNPLGDWTTQTEDAEEMLRSLGVEVVSHMAAMGRGSHSSTFQLNLSLSCH
jgi:hypothetical protein